MAEFDPVSYVDNLELPPLDQDNRKRRELVLTDDDEAGFVDAGQLVAFTAGVSARSKSDVLNCMLLAQLAANVVADREKKTQEWYAKYREVLENIGWAISKFSFDHMTLSGTTFQVKEAVLKLIAAIASENALLISQATIAMVESLGEGDDRVALFSSSSTNSDSGNFQVGAVVEDHGSPTMALAANYFSADEVKTDFLWFHFSTSTTTLYNSGQTISLSEDIYKKVRQQIIDKLGARAETYIADLDIGI